MTTCKGWDSAARRTGTAKSVHASENVAMRNVSFMVAPSRNFSSGEEHRSTRDLARCLPQSKRLKPSRRRANSTGEMRLASIEVEVVNTLLTLARYWRMKLGIGAELQNLTGPARPTGTPSPTEALLEVSQRRAYACYPTKQGTSPALLRASCGDEA